jgi:hypothetical protein
MRAPGVLGVALAGSLLVPAAAAGAAWSAGGAGTAAAGAAALGQPGITATCNGVDAIDVVWTAPAGAPVEAFAVERSTDDGLTWTPVTTVPAAGVASSSYTDAALAEATYVYRVTGTTHGWSVVSELSESRVVVHELRTGKRSERYPAGCT